MDGGAWWAAVHGVTKSQTRLSYFTFTFHFHALEKEMATHSSVLAWRIQGTGEPGGLPSMGSHRVGHDWSDLAAAAGWDGSESEIQKDHSLAQGYPTCFFQEYPSSVFFIFSNRDDTGAFEAEGRQSPQAPLQRDTVRYETLKCLRW